MIKRELARTTVLKWILGPFPSKFVNSTTNPNPPKKPLDNKKKEYTPFPPTQTPLQGRSPNGERWVFPQTRAKEAKAAEAKQPARDRKRRKGRRKETGRFVAPEEESLRRDADGKLKEKKVKKVKAEESFSEDKKSKKDKKNKKSKSLNLPNLNQK